jgi:hypothetical protein
MVLSIPSGAGLKAQGQHVSFSTCVYGDGGYNVIAYKNQREKAVDTAKKREDDARRIEELRQRRIAYVRAGKLEKERQKSEEARREQYVMWSQEADNSTNAARN